VSDSIGGHLTGNPRLTQYARSRRSGQLLFLAGISARQPDNSIRGEEQSPSGALELDIEEQTEGCIRNLASALEVEGLALANVVDVTVFLISMDDYAGFNETWNRFFSDSGPTRTTVAVHQLPDPQLAIELKAIAEFPTRGSR